MTTTSTTPKVTDIKIVKSWTNGFAQSCYELEDGRVVTINYSETNLQIIEGVKRPAGQA